MKLPKSVSVLCLLLGLAACGGLSKEDILKKAKGAETSEQLERALGKPDDLGKLGPVQKWKYKAKDGHVTFIITGGKVAIDMAGKKE